VSAYQETDAYKNQLVPEKSVYRYESPT